MAEIINYYTSECHICNLSIDNSSGQAVRVKFRNESGNTLLDEDSPSVNYNLRKLGLSEGSCFTVNITVKGETEVIHTFVCHYSNFSDAGFKINANIKAATDRMRYSFTDRETDHAENHIRYLEGKINGIYSARINVLYKLPGSTKWERKKSSKHCRGYNVKWDCGVGELNFPNNTEVRLQLDIVWGHTRNAVETYYVRKDSTRRASYEATGTTLNEGFTRKSYE